MKKTITEAELRALVEDGVTHAQIAERLGRHVNAVSAACGVLGIKSPLDDGGAMKLDPEVAAARDARLIDGLRRGLTLHEISREVGLSVGGVTAHLRVRNLPSCARAYLKSQQSEAQAA